MARKSLFPAAVAGLCAIATICGIFVGQAAVTGAPDTPGSPLSIAVVDLEKVVFGSQIFIELSADDNRALKNDYDAMLAAQEQEITKVEGAVADMEAKGSSSKDAIDEEKERIQHLRKKRETTLEARELTQNALFFKTRLHSQAAALVVIREVAKTKGIDMVFKSVNPERMSRDNPEANAAQNLQFFQGILNQASIMYFNGPPPGDPLAKARIMDITGDVTATLKSAKYADYRQRILRELGLDETEKPDAPEPEPPVGEKTGAADKTGAEKTPDEKAPAEKTAEPPAKTS